MCHMQVLQILLFIRIPAKVRQSQKKVSLIYDTAFFGLRDNH